MIMTRSDRDEIMQVFEQLKGISEHNRTIIQKYINANREGQINPMAHDICTLVNAIGCLHHIVVKLQSQIDSLKLAINDSGCGVNMKIMKIHDNYLGVEHDGMTLIIDNILTPSVDDPVLQEITRLLGCNLDTLQHAINDFLEDGSTKKK